MKIRNILLLISALLLSGCGSSGGETSSGTSDGSGSEYVTGMSNGSIVIGAQYCVDSNENDSCDEGEALSTESNKDGYFTFLASQVNVGSVIVAKQQEFKNNALSYGVRYDSLYKFKQSKIIENLEEVQQVSSLSTLENTFKKKLNYDRNQVISYLKDNFEIDLDSVDFNSKVDNLKLEEASIFSSSLLGYLKKQGKEFTEVELGNEKDNLRKIRLSITKMIESSDSKSIEATAKIFEWGEEQVNIVSLAENYLVSDTGDLGSKFTDIIGAEGSSEISDDGVVVPIEEDKYVELDYITVLNYPEYTSETKSIHTEELFEIIPVVKNLSGQEVIFSSVKLPSWLTLDIKTGKLSGTPTVDSEIEEIVINVKAEGGSYKEVANFSIKVISNWVPTIKTVSLDKVSFTENDEPLTQIIEAEDKDGDTLLYFLDNNEDNKSWITIDQPSGTLTITPSKLNVGDFNFTVRVSDGQEEVVKDFSIEVTNVNDIPVSTVTEEQKASWSNSVVETEVYNVDFEVYDLDSSHGDVVTFSLENNPDWLLVEEVEKVENISEEGLTYHVWKMKVSGTPPIGNVGVFSGIVLKAKDSSDEEIVIHTFDIEVLETFYFTTIPESNYVYEVPLNGVMNLPFYYTKNANFSISATVNPVDAWLSMSQTSESVSLIGVASEWPTVETTLHNIVIKLTSEDGSIVKETNPFTIHIYPPNSIPEWVGDASNPYKYIGEGNNYSYTIQATDADVGDTLTYSLTEKPNWLVINPSTGELSGTAPAYIEGEDNLNAVEITVTDGTDNLKYNYNLKVSTGPDWDEDFIPNVIEDQVGLNSLIQNEDGDTAQTPDGKDSDIEVGGIQYGDAFFSNQWHLNSEEASQDNWMGENGDVIQMTTVGNDLNIPEIWGKGIIGSRILSGGEAVLTQIVGGRLDGTHEDLDDNMKNNYSYDYSTQSYTVSVPSKTIPYNETGTIQAGIIAAEAWNGVGIRGMAPFSKISSFNLFNGQNLEDGQTALDWQRAFYVVNPDTVVFNDGVNDVTELDIANSVDISVLTSNYSCAGFKSSLVDFIEWGAVGIDIDTPALRKGKGRVILVPAGDNRGSCTAGGNLIEAPSDVSTNELTSSYSTITVAGVSTDKKELADSTMGSTVFISGYSSNHWKEQPGISSIFYTGLSNQRSTIPTSDVNWWENIYPTYDLDSNKNYTFSGMGTSTATGIVGGSLALVLDVCPTLNYRDVRYLLQKNADTDLGVSGDWITNNAGVKYSKKFGFGLVNPVAIIEECSAGYVNLGEATNHVSDLLASPETILSNGEYVGTSTVTTAGVVEFIKVELDLFDTASPDHSVQLEITSPSGTVNVTIPANTSIGSDTQDMNLFHGVYPFRTGDLTFNEETANGDWTVKVKNTNATSDIVVNELKLTVITK